MSDKKEFNDEMKKAVKNKDFSQINKLLNSTLSTAIKAAQTGIDKVNNYLNKDNNKKYIPAENPRIVLQKLPIDTKAMIYKILGATSLILHGILGFIFFIIATAGHDSQFSDFIENWIIPAIFISYLVLSRGTKLSQKSIRFKKYMRAFGKSSICSIKDLSHAVNRPIEKVIRDFDYFIRKDYLKEARFIENHSYVVLDNATYQEYKKSLLDKYETVNDLKEESEVQNSEDTKDEYLNYRQKYITELKNIENNLNGDIKNKVNQLISIAEKIFNFNEKYPETASTTYKFMEYYLPTTVKILESYVEYAKIDVKGENIISAMNDIENAMDTIILALSKFLDNLYQDSTLDVHTDISVLKTVLSQDGLLDKDFNTQK